MDRVEFINSIKDPNGGNKENLLLNFFDHYMILYELIERVDDIEVINSDSSSVSFKLKFSDPKILNRTVEKLKTQSMLMIFEKYYNISYSDITENTVNITISLM